MEVLHEIDGRQDRGAYADLGDVLFDLVLAVEVRDARLSIGPRSAAKKSYSITASASCWSCQGTSRPSTFAVFMLIDSSNLVGSCMGATARVLG